MLTTLLHWREYTRVSVGLPAIVNPLLAIPVFTTLARDDSEKVRRGAARRTALTVAVIVT